MLTTSTETEAKMLAMWRYVRQARASIKQDLASIDSILNSLDKILELEVAPNV